MEHKLATNTVVMVEFDGGIRQFTLKSEPGPVLKEERVSVGMLMTNAWQIQAPGTVIYGDYGHSIPLLITNGL